MLEHTKYGIEYKPKSHQDSGGFGWVVVLVIVLSLISLVMVRYHRYLTPGGEDVLPVLADEFPSEAAPTSSVEVVEEDSRDPVVPPAGAEVQIERRPTEVVNLLMKLDEAMRLKDIELQVSAIERLRSLPGSPAADLDDRLARLLGRLNKHRLFENKNPKWVKKAKVSRRDTASSIAAENGCTMAAFVKLNGKKVEKLKKGDEVYVLNQPRCQLVVHRRAGYADLLMKGKFFKRYDLKSADKSADGMHEYPVSGNGFWKKVGLGFEPDDIKELEMLLTKGSPVLVSEL